MLRLRAEETGGLAEPVLNAATGRTRWALSHISVAGGAAVLLMPPGVGLLGYGLLTGQVGTGPGPDRRRAGPAARGLVLAAVAVLLFGLLPWASVALADGGRADRGDHGVRPAAGWQLADGHPPFTRVPRLPGAAVTAGPLLWLSGIALAVRALGLPACAGATSATWARRAWAAWAARSATGWRTISSRRPRPCSYPPLSLASCGLKPTAAGNFDTQTCSWATLASLALVVLNRRPWTMSMVG